MVETTSGVQRAIRSVTHRLSGETPELPIEGRLPGFDGATVVWDLYPDAWLAAACDLAGRDLSDDESARYLPDREPERLCEAG